MNKPDKRKHLGYYLPKVETKDFNVMIYVRIFFDEPVKNKLGTKENIRKIVTAQGNDYTTGFLLDYPYFKEIIS